MSNLGIILSLIVGWSLTVFIALRIREKHLLAVKTIRGLFVAVGFALTTMVVGMYVLQDAANTAHDVAIQSEYDRCANTNANRQLNRDQDQSEIAAIESQLRRFSQNGEFDLTAVPGFTDIQDPAVQETIDNIIGESVTRSDAFQTFLDSELVRLEAEAASYREDFPIVDCGPDPSGLDD